MAAKSSYQWNHDFSKLARDTGFIFNTRKPNVVINWNDIKAIDVDRVVQERDFATVDEHLHQVLDCQLEKEFDVRILDAGFVKLFRLAQLSVEYLLYCRTHLDIVIPQLKNQIRDMEEEIDQLKKQLHSKEEEIRRLRNKTRKQQKTMDYVKNNDIANLLRRMAMNDGQIGVSSMGDQASKSFHKCIHCDKVFLSQFYLHSHLVRRHPNLSSFGGDDLRKNIEDNTTNNSPLHEAKYKEQNEKLLIEIKELKDRVNATEKQLHFKEFNNDLVKSKNNDTDNIDNVIVVKHKENNNEIIEESKDKVELDAMEKESVNLATFEEWKKTEQRNFLEQLEILKKQFTDREIVLNKVNEEKDKARATEEMLAMKNMLKQHETEANALKEQLREKMTSDFIELKSNLELQEKLWQQKMQNSEEEHRRTVEELKSTTLARLTESQTIQEQYKNRIDTLETSAREQKIILDDQSRKLSVVGETRNSSPGSIVNPIRKTTSLEVHKRLREGESHETLPPYDEGSSDESIKPRTFLTDDNSHNSVRDYKSKKKIRTPVGESESDDTSKIESVINLQGSVSKNRDVVKVTSKTVTVSSDSSFGNKQKKTHSKLNKPKNIASENSPVKNMRSQKSGGRKTVTKNGNHNSQAVNLRKNKSLSKPRDLEESDTETENSDTSGSAPIVRPTNGGNLMKAVKNDLDLIVNKRLEQLGVLSDARGLSVEAFEKSMAVVEHRRKLLTKKHNNFNRLRKGLNSALEQKVKNNTSPSVSVHVNKSNVSLNKMGSLFSSVKNKAISIMKSRENVENIQRETSGRPKGLSQIVRASYKKSPEKKNVSQIKKKSNRSILSILNNIKETSGVKEIEIDKSSNDLRLSLTESSSNSESSEDIESENNNTKQIVTTVVSHASSKSLEKLLISPIRRPSKPKNDEEISIASSTPTKKFDSSANKFGNVVENDKQQSHKAELKESVERSISKSEDNIPSMYAGATSSSNESDFDDRHKDLRKSVSEENVNKVRSQKSVLKSVLSSGSLSKKKVLFDLDANEMKSVSTSPTVSGAIEVKAKENWELRASADTDSDSEWEISNVESDPINHNATVHYNPAEEIKLSTKQSPKIAEISKTIGQQLGARTVKPPAGGIDTMLQNKLDQSSPKKSDNDISGNALHNATVLNTASTSLRININQPIPKPRTVTQIKKNTLDSDLELSDWSLDDLINAK